MKKIGLILLGIVTCLSAPAATNLAGSGEEAGSAPALPNSEYCETYTYCPDSGRRLWCWARGVETALCTRVPGYSVSCTGAGGGEPPAYSSDQCP